MTILLYHTADQISKTLLGWWVSSQETRKSWVWTEINGICLSSQDLRNSDKSNIEEIIIDKVLFQTKIYIIYTKFMITTQGEREMHSNISINLSKKSNSKRNYPTETRTYNSRNTSSSESLYAQAVNGQLKNPASSRRTTHSTATTSTSWTTHTRTVNSARTTNTRATTSRTNYTQWADKTLSSANFLKHRNQAPTQSIADLKKLVKKDEIPVRVFGLWWLEEIWINMTVIEYKDDIIIVDAGLEFASFDMHGVDYIIPDIS